MSKTKLGITETMEILLAIDALAKCVAEAKKDGIINVWDAPKFSALILPAKKAVEGAENIALELKDLEADEIKTVVDKLFESMMALAAAVVSKPAT